MATRPLRESLLDYGAQFFTVRDIRFQEAVDQWESSDWVAPWFIDGGHARYKAVGGMNTLARHLAKPFDLRTETTVESVEPSGQGWRIITGAEEHFRADALLLTPPAPQSLALLTGCAHRLPSEITSALKSIEFDPCFSLLATVDGTSRVPAPGYVRPDQGPLEWIADNTQKGISMGEAALTIHARADFSGQFFDTPPDCVASLLLEAAEPWLGGEVTARRLHRWKYSRPVSASGPMCLYSRQPAGIAFAGDAFGGARVEGAFLSGLAAAEKIAESGT